MDGFLGLRVIELASVLAGPMVGSFFSELGADVLKIENERTGGDVTRQWRLPSESGANEFSAYYCSANWGKEVWLADLKDREVKERVYDLVREADVVVVNFKQGDAEKLGMNYATFRVYNPRIIYGEITGFGKGSKRMAFDVVLQAETGFMFMNGHSDSGPVKMPVALIDLLAAHQLKQGLLLALLQREQQGIAYAGALVTVSLFDAAVASLANQAGNWLMVGHIPQPMGSLHPNIAPYGEIFESKEGKQLVLAVGNDRQFENMCRVLGIEELASDLRFQTNAARVKNRDLLFEKLRPCFLNWNLTDLLDQFEKEGVPAGAIRNMQAVFEQEASRQLVMIEELPDGQISKRVRTVVFEII